jgi:UPF0755 protein
MPPKPGPPPRNVSRKRIRARRLGVLALLLLILATGIGIALAAGGSGSKTTAPTTTAIVFEHQFRIIFPEGFTRQQMALRVQAVARIAHRERGVRPKLSRRTYLAATRAKRRIPGFGSKPLPLEGFLFPATYNFTKRTTSVQLVATQLKTFEANWGTLDLRYARSKNLTPYDVLNIAAMVEKETLAPDERPLVAAVIYNRLHARMPLGIDATLRYGLHIPPTQSILQSQLDSDNPYNTRKLLGLPPTPIANPGLASMQAAAHPAHVHYIYFVRKPDHVHHFFTASFNAFQAYERKHGYHPH